MQQLQQETKYKWENVKEYMDLSYEREDMPSNSNCKFITLRELRDLFEEGETITTLEEKKYAVGLLKFFAFLLRGELTITKEEFEKLYNGGKKVCEIVEEKGLPKHIHSYLLRTFGIKNKGIEFFKKFGTDVPLSQRQREIIYGCLIGKSCVRRGENIPEGLPGKALYFKSRDNKDYSSWKMNEFDNIISKKSIKTKEYEAKDSGIKSIEYLFYTEPNTEISLINRIFYPNNKRDFTMGVLSGFTSLSLAVWFMDNGITDWYNDFREEDEESDIKEQYILNTDYFSKEGIDLMISYLKSKFDISSRKNTVKLYDSIGYRIVINEESNTKFLETVKPHILSIFNWKIDYNSYLEYRELKIKENPNFDFDEMREFNIKEKVSISPNKIVGANINIQDVSKIYNSLVLEKEENDKILEIIKNLNVIIYKEI